MEHMDPVGALGRFAIMYNVGDEVVGGILVYRLHFFRQILSQVHISEDDENKVKTRQSLRG